MSGSSDRFRLALLQWLRPGAVYTFVGAGGKTTAIKCAAEELARSGLKVRVTTTTRVGIQEFQGYPLRLARDERDFASAISEVAVLLLVTAGETDDGLKYRGIDPALLDSMTVPPDTVVLVEGDGSRRLPMKVPRAHEPVVPRSSAAVFALMGAIAFGGPIDEGTCYNHEKALALLDAMRPGPRERTRFTAEVVAALAAHPEGGRKGVLPGMSFRVLLNQGDLEEHEKTALEALDLVRQVHRVPAALVSFQKREMYGAAD